MARSSVLFPAPEGPTTAVILPFGMSASTPLRISTPPVAYLRPEILIPRGPMLEHLPAQIGVEPIEDGVGVARQGRVVRQDELHAAYDGVEAVRLGAAVLVVHQVGVVHYLRDLDQYGILQRILLEESLEGAIVPAMREPGTRDVKELHPIGRLSRVLEVGEGGLVVYEAPYQPHAGRAVHVAPAAGRPQHQPPSAALLSAEVPPPTSIRRAARKAWAASIRKGERK